MSAAVWNTVAAVHTLGVSDRLSASHILMAFLWAAIGGILAWLLTYPLHRRSLGGLLAAVVLTGIGATVAGVMGSVRDMSIPAHQEASMIIVAVVAGLVASVIAARAARRLARDNQVVRDAVAELGAGRVPSSAGPRLSPQLERMRTELAETAQRLATSRQREQALESARRELVAWVSHDLRTPLASLRAMTEALEDGVAEDPELYYKQMRSSVDRLARMVDDLFELSRIQAGRITLETDQLALDDLVSDCLATLGPLAKAQGVQLTGHASGPITITGSAPELGRALINVVANGIRHTHPDGTVEVSARPTSTGVAVTVADECGGIAEHDLARLFDVGYRGELARSPGAQNPAGAGLGLAITRGIIEAHGGTVEVANINGGCQFTLQLPRES